MLESLVTVVESCGVGSFVVVVGVASRLQIASCASCSSSSSVSMCSSILLKLNFSFVTGQHPGLMPGGSAAQPCCAPPAGPGGPEVRCAPPAGPGGPEVRWKTTCAEGLAAAAAAAAFFSSSCFFHVRIICSAHVSFWCFLVRPIL